MFKKLVFSITAIAAISFSATAQKYISIGPVVGFNHTGVTNGEMNNTVDIQSKFNPNFHAGISLIYSKNEHWGFGGQLLFSQEGFKKEFSDKRLNIPFNIPFEGSYKASYIRIPLRAYYFFGDYKSKIRPKVYAGPSIGIKVMDERLPVIGLTDLEMSILDLGLQAGVGVNIALSKATWLNLDLNYTQGLLDVLNSPSLKTGYNMNQNLGFQVGVLFGLK